MGKEELYLNLEKFGFSKMESIIYVELLKNKCMTGYQIAKNLNIARASVYPVLEELLKKGAVLLISGEPNQYRAEEPVTLISRMNSEYNKRAELLKKGLSEINKSDSGKKYVNIEGMENIIAKVKEMLLRSNREVYINTDFELEYFKSEFEILKERGVRIILFTFANIETKEFPLEIYHNKIETSKCKNKIIMMVSDMNMALTAGVEENGEFIGTVSENRLFTKIIAEHIHHDIYLLNLKNKNGKDMIEKDILIGSIQEKRDY